MPGRLAAPAQSPPEHITTLQRGEGAARLQAQRVIDVSEGDGMHSPHLYFLRKRRSVQGFLTRAASSAFSRMS